MFSSLSSLFCAVFVFLCQDGGAPDRKLTDDARGVTEALIRKVESLQQKRHVPYVPLLEWEKRVGMWESDVRFYFHGHEDMFVLREAFSVYDNNMFVTAWISSCLLEAYRFGNTSKPSTETVKAAVLSIKEYHDKNVAYNNSLMTFWPQVYNDTYQTWISYPVNVHHLFDLFDVIDFSIIEELLAKFGFGDIAKIIKHILQMKDIYLQAFMIPPDFDDTFVNLGLDEIRDIYLQAFMIPPDFDDTFVNLGLGSLLSELQADFPDAHAQWRTQNTNVTSAFDALKKYAYRPMSDNLAINTIDPRTYYVMRHFLEEAKLKGESIALVTTWVQDIDEAAKSGHKGAVMPFNINNVDVTIAANTIYGITAGILSGVVDVNVLDDPDIQQIYLNTSNLIATMIRTNFSDRHDLALLYYPSAAEFYWFVARTYAELNSRSQAGPLPHQVLDAVMTTLGDVLHKDMTSALLKQMREDKDGNMYIDDFLGDGDLDQHNNTVVRGEDRLFTTGMAVNALLSTWTTFEDKNRRLVWQKETPKAVKDSIKKAVNFVKDNIFGLGYQPWNAFFSGSVKGNSTIPIYPCNRVNKKGTYLHGMEGVIPEVEYQRMLSEGHYVIDFHGFNSYPDNWPFWSSEPYTYVTTMLALAKFSNTHDI